MLTQKILPDIKAGKTVLVVAHANSLRGKKRKIEHYRLKRSRVGYSRGKVEKIVEKWIRVQRV